jgi:hypothetical protein
MKRNQPALFKGRHFEAEIIVLCVRWYLRFGLSFRNLEELMVERHPGRPRHNLALGSEIWAEARTSLPPGTADDEPIPAGG